MEKPLRFDRMSGLDSGQLDELEPRVAEMLENPWKSATGRPKGITFREAIIIASGYTRQNIIQDVWAEIFDISQPGVSRIITEITPLIEKATAEFRPGAEEAKAAVRGQTVLVDGFLAPCWSWRGIPDLWSGKHKTTGFCSQVISNLQGDVIFVSEPLTGHNHDMTVLSETKTAEIIAEAFSGIGDKGYQGSGYSTRLSHLCGWGLPGQADGADFCGCQLVRARWPIFRGDDDAPELGGHVGG